ncbi:unnamed protein product [Acanthoscelides obtectus]|uniref:Uncharacterized protein n=1 Tax=Acanthoscelides obtectus TaxID=200917 RepID=A0A9P0KST6_ACAOB|nr:unnamed protein product [Acanthoscelides obtectus]CAK1652689.1 hypothetical protein AOBTE_LOCUS17892 [Acanthoscelides obtectus]
MTRLLLQIPRFVLCQCVLVPSLVYPLKHFLLVKKPYFHRVVIQLLKKVARLTIRIAGIIAIKEGNITCFILR